MPLTREFKETVKSRAERDPSFRKALFVEAMNCFLDGDTQTGKLILRDYINATTGFDELARETGKSPKSLMRMFSRDGNPNANNLFAVIAELQKQSGVRLAIEAEE